MIKQTLIIIFLVQTFLTIHPEIYECKNKGKVFILELSEDSTYHYTHPFIFHNDFVTDTGKWEFKKDTLLLKDSILREHRKDELINKYINGQSYITILIVDEKNTPLPNIEVALNLDDHFKKTDSLGFVRFDYKELKKEYRFQRDSIISDIQLGKDEDGGGGYFGYDLEHTNHIKIVIDKNPIYKKEMRIRKLLVQNDVLIFKDPLGMHNGQTIKLKKKK